MNDNEEKETLAYRMSPLKFKPDDFYGDPNSIYIKCTYVPEHRGFKFYVFNQLANSIKEEDDIHDDVMNMAILVRGMVAAAMDHTPDIFSLGLEAMEADAIDIDDMPDEHKELLKGKTAGNA